MLFVIQQHVSGKWSNMTLPMSTRDADKRLAYLKATNPTGRYRAMPPHLV